MNRLSGSHSEEVYHRGNQHGDCNLPPPCILTPHIPIESNRDIISCDVNDVDNIPVSIEHIYSESEAQQAEPSHASYHVENVHTPDVSITVSEVDDLLAHIPLPCSHTDCVQLSRCESSKENFGQTYTANMFSSHCDLVNTHGTPYANAYHYDDDLCGAHELRTQTAHRGCDQTGPSDFKDDACIPPISAFFGSVCSEIGVGHTDGSDVQSTGTTNCTNSGGIIPTIIFEDQVCAKRSKHAQRPPAASDMGYDTGSECLETNVSLPTLRTILQPTTKFSQQPYEAIKNPIPPESNADFYYTSQAALYDPSGFEVSEDQPHFSSFDAFQYRQYPNLDASSASLTAVTTPQSCTSPSNDVYCTMDGSLQTYLLNLSEGEDSQTSFIQRYGAMHLEDNATEDCSMVKFVQMKDNQVGANSDTYLIAPSAIPSQTYDPIPVSDTSTQHFQHDPVPPHPDTCILDRSNKFLPVVMVSSEPSTCLPDLSVVGVEQQSDIANTVQLGPIIHEESTQSSSLYPVRFEDTTSSAGSGLSEQTTKVQPELESVVQTVENKHLRTKNKSLIVTKRLRGQPVYPTLVHCLPAPTRVRSLEANPMFVVRSGRGSYMNNRGRLLNHWSSSGLPYARYLSHAPMRNGGTSSFRASYCTYSPSLQIRKRNLRSAGVLVKSVPVTLAATSQRRKYTVGKYGLPYSAPLSDRALSISGLSSLMRNFPSSTHLSDFLGNNWTPSPHQIFPDSSPVHGCRLHILTQPESQHRARYQTEGSRGSVKDRQGTGYPTIKLSGWDGPAILQVFVCVENGRPRPHPFYQAYLITGRSDPCCIQTIRDGVNVVEMVFTNKHDWTLSIESVGILKLRKHDVEHRTLQTAYKSRIPNGTIKSTGTSISVLPTPNLKPPVRRQSRARLVFRAVLFDTVTCSLDTVQTVSEPILCTQSISHPEISRLSTSESAHTGGGDLFILGKHLSKDCHVFFRQLTADGGECFPNSGVYSSLISPSCGGGEPGMPNGVWVKEATLNMGFCNQSHIVCSIPEYTGPSDPHFIDQISVDIIVRCGTQWSNVVPFVYRQSTSATVNL